MKLINKGNMDSFKCCICNGSSWGYGNNPAPMIEKSGARACGACNATYVKRWRDFMSLKVPEKKKQLELIGVDDPFEVDERVNELFDYYAAMPKRGKKRIATPNEYIGVNYLKLTADKVRLDQEKNYLVDRFELTSVLSCVNNPNELDYWVREEFEKDRKKDFAEGAVYPQVSKAVIIFWEDGSAMLVKDNVYGIATSHHEAYEHFFSQLNFQMGLYDKVGIIVSRDDVGFRAVV